MLLEDLQHIFKPQIDQSWEKLRFSWGTKVNLF